MKRFGCILVAVLLNLSNKVVAGDDGFPMPFERKAKASKAGQGGLQIKNEVKNEIKKEVKNKVKNQVRVPKSMKQPLQVAAQEPKPIENAFFFQESSGDLDVLACNASFVEVQGPQATSLRSLSYLMVMTNGDTVCSFCSPLFRFIQSIEITSKGTTLLSTKFASLGEVLGDIVHPEFEMEPLEPLFGCSHSIDCSSCVSSSSTNKGGTRRILVPVEDNAKFGSCNDKWQVKDGAGQCSFTHCFVGPDTDPSVCFECKNECDNGCGPKDIPWLNTDGNFKLVDVGFDFGPACCNHDFCWSSYKFSKDACDFEFWKQMVSQCSMFFPLPVKSRLHFPMALYSRFQQPSILCNLLADLFYAGVSTGKSFWETAQRKQKEHENSDVCTQKCPATLISGTESNTEVTIDLLRRNGTFTVEYEMYENPDRLFIDYFGERIFDTGVPVSGHGIVNVTYSGWTNTKIQLTVDASTDETDWAVSINCPNPSPDPPSYKPTMCPDYNSCPSGSSCDPLDGLCKRYFDLIPCIAVISYSPDTLEQQHRWWSDFRNSFPDRPLCLLVPGSGANVQVPDAFLQDKLTTLHTGIALDEGDQDKALDWFTLCGLNLIQPARILFVGLVIDDSTHLGAHRVAASIDLFMRKMEDQRTPVLNVTDAQEEWIKPFFVDLGPQSADCVNDDYSQSGWCVYEENCDPRLMLSEQKYIDFYPKPLLHVPMLTCERFPDKVGCCAH